MYSLMCKCMQFDIHSTHTHNVRTAHAGASLQKPILTLLNTVQTRSTPLNYHPQFGHDSLTYAQRAGGLFGNHVDPFAMEQGNNPHTSVRPLQFAESKSEEAEHSPGFLHYHPNTNHNNNAHNDNSNNNNWEQ